VRIGIGASRDVTGTVERCRQLGVQQVFLSCAALPGYAERGYPDAEALRAFKGRLEEQGIAVPSATYWFAKWPPRPWLRSGATNPDILLTRDRRCIDAMLRMIELLGEAGITSVLHYVDLGQPADAAEAEACWEGLREIYHELIPVAERRGVGIGNHSLHRLLPDGVRERAVVAAVGLGDYGRYEAEGWGGPFLVGTWEELRRLVNAVPSPNNGVTLCTGMDIPGGDVPALVAEFAGRIHFCQLRDHTERWPGGREVPLGEGRIEFPPIIAALRAAGYQGMVHPEHLGKPRYDGEDVLAAAVAYVERLLDRD
jgi:sugar phosphate isomerase/epimerase